MENNDSNPKPQTGGLKLMTVFIVVLALHVLVIGGFTIYHLVSGGSTDADIVTDKPHKDVKAIPDNTAIGDTQIADTTEKSPNSNPATAPADTSVSPMTIPVPAAENTPANVPTPNTTTSNPSTVSTVPSPTVPPAPVTPAPVTPASTPPTSSEPSGPIASTGPVINPPMDKNPEPTKEDAASKTQLDASTGTSNYTVKSHDSLARIAHRHHVSVAALKSVNGLKSDMLRIGQKLSIPEKSPSEAPTGLAALREPNTTMLGDDPMPSEKVASTPRDKSEISAPVSGRHVYTVAKGDTLSRIAHRFHTTANAIMTLNNIGDARKLRLGQKLKIPSQESRSATSTPARSPAPDKIEPRTTPSAQLANFIN